jgi:hypothetical protein
MTEKQMTMMEQITALAYLQCISLQQCFQRLTAEAIRIEDWDTLDELGHLQRQVDVGVMA